MSVNCKDPSQVLRSLPVAIASIGCKPLFDMATKNTAPKCEEARAAIEALIIEKRGRESCQMRWMDSRAMLSGAFTKQKTHGWYTIA